jgi:hypothetical protein
MKKLAVLDICMRKMTKESLAGYSDDLLLDVPRPFEDGNMGRRSSGNFSRQVKL